jgi:hypothetical protein
LPGRFGEFHRRECEQLLERLKIESQGPVGAGDDLALASRYCAFIDVLPEAVAQLLGGRLRDASRHQ